MVEKTKNKKYNYAIILGFSLFLGLIIAYFAILSPLYKKSKAITNEVKAKQISLERLKDKKQKLIALKEKEEQLKEDAKKVEAALPDNAAVGRLFIQLNELVNSSRGTVNSISAGNGVETADTTSGISNIQFSIPSTFNSYFDLKDFIAKSETALRIFDIKSVSLTGGSAGEMTATLNANTYVRK